MTTPVAVDYPPAIDGPLMVYPGTTDFGDGLYEACGSPAGWDLEVVTQPAHGTVEFYPPTQSWRHTQVGSPPHGYDSFTYRLRSGDSVSNTATVSLEIAEV